MSGPKGIGDKTIISLFDKAKKEIVCPSFMELKPFNGCEFDCQWCYLNGTYRMKKDEKGLLIGKKPTYKDAEKVEKHLRRALEEIDVPTMFNVGEVSDGLLFPWMLGERVIKPFREWHPKHGHKALLLTKSTKIADLYLWKAQDFIVPAWSLNAIYVAQRWEKGAPHPFIRIDAARKVRNWGYPVRFRIDPMVPVPGWKDAYRVLVEQLMREVPDAEVITLGSLRMTKTNLRVCKKLEKNTSYTEYLDEETSRDFRCSHDKRVEMYDFVIRLLRELDYKGHIALCKETEAVWEELSSEIPKTKRDAAVPPRLPPYKKAVCNCMMLPITCPGLCGKPPEEESP